MSIFEQTGAGMLDIGNGQRELARALAEAFGCFGRAILRSIDHSASFYG
jgi:ubiquinone/menaquinone biosynthesis C-methylase UbiE